jgi:hypothetical protein
LRRSRVDLSFFENVVESGMVGLLGRNVRYRWREYQHRKLVSTPTMRPKQSRLRGSGSGS